MNGLYNSYFNIIKITFLQGYIKSLSEAEKEKINSLRVGTVWKSEQMKKMPSDNIFLINEKIAALEAELEAGTNQQVRHICVISQVAI